MSTPTHTSPSSSPAASLLQDDYGTIDLSGMARWVCPSLTLESGQILVELPVCYKTFGQLSPSKDNAIFVPHALTGHAGLDEWWGSLLGPSKAFDTDEYFIICANLLGSCYGTAGPTEINPLTQQRYGPTFPYVTVRDTVNLHQRLIRDHLGIHRLAACIGGSLGGMQSLEWAFFGPEVVEKVVVLACGAKQEAWQIGLNGVQRAAITADPLWQDGWYDPSRPPASGLGVARQLAMITYRTYSVYANKFARRERKPSGPQNGSISNGIPNGTTPNGSTSNESTLLTSNDATSPSPSPPSVSDSGISASSLVAPSYDVESYLAYQGAKLVARFDCNSYIRVTQMLDSHDVGRNRGGIVAALNSLQQPFLVMGIDSDVLYPIEEQREIAANIRNSEFEEVHSLEGHDGFLLEQKQIGAAIQAFLKKHDQRKK